MFLNVTSKNNNNHIFNTYSVLGTVLSDLLKTFYFFIILENYRNFRKVTKKIRRILIYSSSSKWPDKPQIYNTCNWQKIKIPYIFLKISKQLFKW